MARIVKVSESDYTLKVRSGGTITFDTRNSLDQPLGTVIIKGKLEVTGSMSTIESTDTTIKDNKIRLNYDPNSPYTGDGIPSSLDYESGLQINRGTRPEALFVFNDNIQHYDPSTTAQSYGTYVFKTVDGELQGIQTDCIVTDGSTDFIFDLKNSNHVIRIENGGLDAIEYTNRLLLTLAQTSHDNDVPNRKFVTEYITSGAFDPGIADVDKLYFASPPGPEGEKARVQAFSTYIEFAIDKIQRAQITSSGLDVDHINLFGNTVSNSTSHPLILTSYNNHVEVDAILDLDDQASDPLAVGGTTRIYSKSNIGTTATGKSGIFFANDITQDELVAKNRALLFSMLF